MRDSSGPWPFLHSGAGPGSVVVFGLREFAKRELAERFFVDRPPLLERDDFLKPPFDRRAAGAGAWGEGANCIFGTD